MLIYVTMGSLPIQSAGDVMKRCSLFSQYVSVYKRSDLGDVYDLDFVIFSMNDLLSLGAVHMR